MSRMERNRTRKKRRRYVFFSFFICLMLFFFGIGAVNQALLSVMRIPDEQNILSMKYMGQTLQKTEISERIAPYLEKAFLMMKQIREKWTVTR